MTWHPSSSHPHPQTDRLCHWCWHFDEAVTRNMLWCEADILMKFLWRSGNSSFYRTSLKWVEVARVLQTYRLHYCCIYFIIKLIFIISFGWLGWMISHYNAELLLTVLKWCASLWSVKAGSSMVSGLRSRTEHFTFQCKSMKPFGTSFHLPASIRSPGNSVHHLNAKSMLEQKTCFGQRQ